MALIEKLKELIAQRAGVRPEDVTPEFIRRRRESLEVEIEDENDYGGWSHDGLEHLTDKEVELAKKSFEELVAEGTTKED